MKYEATVDDLMAKYGTGNAEDQGANKPRTIKEMLLLAKSKGVLWPKIKLGGYTFKMAGDTSKNPGAVYVYDASKQYLGKIVDNKVNCYNQGHEEHIQKLIDDPRAAAMIHGQMTGTCCICGRTLLNANSIAEMIGPICAEKYGF